MNQSSLRQFYPRTEKLPLLSLLWSDYPGTSHFEIGPFYELGNLSCYLNRRGLCQPSQPSTISWKPACSKAIRLRSGRGRPENKLDWIQTFSLTLTTERDAVSCRAPFTSKYEWGQVSAWNSTYDSQKSLGIQRVGRCMRGSVRAGKPPPLQWIHQAWVGTGVAGTKWSVPWCDWSKSYRKSMLEFWSSKCDASYPYKPNPGHCKAI